MTILIQKQIAKILCHLDSNEVQVEAFTVREAIEKLGEMVPFYNRAIRDGKVNHIFSLDLNGVNIKELEGLNTPVKKSDVLVVLSMIPYEITAGPG